MNDDNFHNAAENLGLCVCCEPMCAFRVFCSENTSGMELITKRSIERNDIDGLWYKHYTAFLKKLLWNVKY